MNEILPSHEIETRLEAVRLMIRRTQRTRALFLITTVALGGLLLAMAADLIFAPLPSAVRWVLFVLWIVGIIMVSLRAMKPLFRVIPLIRIARWLEDRHPEMQERLSTVLELSGSRDGVSLELLDEIARVAGHDIGTINASDEVRSARKRRQWKAPALFAAGVLLLVLAAWPQAAFRLLLRAIAPFSDVGNAVAAEFQITPGNTELLEGDALKISFSISDRKSTPQLWLETPSLGDTIQPVTEENGRFAFTLDPVKETVRYQVRAGRSQSDTFTASVLPMPVLTKTKATLEYPSYTALPKAELDPAKGIKAVAGTKVSLTAAINTPLESAWIEMGGKRIAEGRLQNSSRGGSLTFDWLLNADSTGEALVILSHRLRPRIETLRFQVEVTGDKAPEVAILSPERRELKVRPDDTVPLRYEVIEDYGLAEVAIEIEAVDKKSSLVQPLPARFGSSRPPQYRGEAPLVVGRLSDLYPKVREFRVRITASDAKSADLGGPGIGHSDWIILRVDQYTPSLARQELRAQREEARKTIAEAIQDARQAKQQANNAENGMRKEEPPKEAAETLQKAAGNLAKAEETSRELAKDLTESLHASKTDEVEAASEVLAQAREKIENAPLQETGEQRGEQLREADKQIEKAISQLEKVRDEIEKDQQRAEDVVALQELANRQNELARQAESKATPTPEASADPQADKQWNKQQEQVAQELQREVAERPEAKAEALKAQAEKARDLAEKANELAEAQKQLGKESQQLAAGKPDTGNETKPPTPGDLAEKQQNQAEAAADLAEQIEALPSLESNDPTRQAAEAAEQGAKAAEAAAGEMAKAAAKPETPSKPSPGKPSASEPSPGKPSASEPSPGEPSASEPSPGKPGAENAGAQPAESPTPGGEPSAAPPSSPEAKAAAEAAAPLNERAGEQMAKSAAALEQAAAQFEQAAQAAAAQAQSGTPPQDQAQAPAAPMAAALEAASQAAAAQDAGEAAEQSAAAAQALAEAAAAAQQAMKGGKPSQGPPGPDKPGAKPGPPGPPGPPKEPSANAPMADFRTPGADPGVPPELAKLGISAADWERIKATLGSDVGAAETEGVPAEYRSLVKDYFQNLTKPAVKTRER